MSLKPSSRVKQRRRVGDGWVSYNRFLVGNTTTKKNVGRNPNFDTDETKLLIQLWGDPKVQRTLITTHKKHSVICQLAAQMQEYGYYRSPEEITTRIKNLKCFYNRLKKDMEAGRPQSEPTWRHFSEMDAIMTRPIFSVRPNEVPQPSLKYQLEQRTKERDEKNSLEEGRTSEAEDEDDNANKSTSGQDIDDGIIPDVEVDMDINDETLAALTAANEGSPKAIGSTKKLKNSKGSKSHMETDMDQCDDDDDDEEKELQIKEETDCNSGDEPNDDHIKVTNEAETKCDAEMEMESLASVQDSLENDKDASGVFITPKEEPIDVDAEEETNIEKDASSNTTSSCMPTLTEMLKISKSSASNTSATNTIITTNGNIFTSVASLTTATSALPTAVITTPSTQGKISLVPTNFLLQPKGSAAPVTSQPMQLIPNVITSQATMQPRILLSQGGTAGCANKSPAGIVTTGPGGMKVLLVNAEQAGTQGLTSNGLQKTIGAVKCKIQPQKGHTQQLHQLLQKQQQPQQIKIRLPGDQARKSRKIDKTELNACESTSQGEDGMRRKDAISMRLLLRQLLDSQEKNNDIQNERLALERERLEFEKSAMERLLGILPNLFGAPPQQHIQLQRPPELTPAPTAMLFNPSKLVFTSSGTAAFATTVPSVNGATAVFAPTNNFTATTPLTNGTSQSVDMCTQIDDIQLVSPKIEKEE